MECTDVLLLICKLFRWASGVEPAQVQERVENHLKSLLIKHFDPQKADSIFTVEGEVGVMSRKEQIHYISVPVRTAYQIAIIILCHLMVFKMSLVCCLQNNMFNKRDGYFNKKLSKSSQKVLMVS